MLSLFILVCAVAAIGIFVSISKAARGRGLYQSISGFLVIFLGLLMTGWNFIYCDPINSRIFF